MVTWYSSFYEKKIIKRGYHLVYQYKKIYFPVVVPVICVSFHYFLISQGSLEYQECR